MGAAVVSLHAPHTSPNLHGAAPDRMIALLARLECEDNEKLEASTEKT